jgi:hypothetical protein
VVVVTARPNEAALPAPASPVPPANASRPPRRRRLEIEEIGDVTVVSFVDRKLLDEQNIQIIGDELFRLVDELGRRKICNRSRGVGPVFFRAFLLGWACGCHKRACSVIELTP